VTIVFADLVGSTALHERLDAEAVRQFMEGYYAAMRGAVEAQGGRVTQLMGDGVKAVFGAPRVAEDDAIRAIRAAVAMQDAFRALLGEKRGRVGNTGLRVAVNTGEVVADDAAEIIGDPVNVAARLQEQGKDGDVVIGGSTQRIVASLVTLDRLGSFALKGRAEAVEAWRVVSLDAPAAARAAAFVGRDDELRRLLAVYETALAAPATRLAVLLGSPGLGKSRLLDELAQRLGDDATVLAARCDASGGATFAPLAAALRTRLGLEGAEGDELRAAIVRAVPGSDEERARIAAGIEALLAGTPLSPEETFYDVRRLLAALATEKPVVLAIDDLHWAEPLLLDLIEHLVQWGTGVRLLVLAAARPELRDARSSLVVPGAVAADVVTLAGLDATSASRLAASVIGADALPAAVAGRVLTTSEGNPLFLRELVRMLVNDGVLRREGERWALAVAVADLDIPPTIQALLAARIERLRPEERLVLERAAVVGRHFSRAAVAQLLPQGDDLDARLESLRRSELIEPDTGWFLGEPALRFHHVLIRDAGYRRVLKGTRAELHARLADWIEAKPGEHDEMLGWHLEQAHQNLRELGPLDGSARGLGERAARHLGAAGRRALARDDLPLASGLLGRALDRLDADDPARADLALDWCEALLTAGDVGPAAPAVEELGRLAAGSDRLGAWHTCFAGQLAVLTDPEALRSTASAVAAAAGVLAAAGDATGEAKAHAVHATALARLGENGACEAAIDRALAAARRVRDRRRQNAVLAAGPLAALWGPSPVTRASGRCLDFVRVLRITQGSPAVEAVALRCQAVLEALRGRSDAARRMIAAARRMVEELGITQQLLEVDVFAAHIDLLEGDAAAAERTLRVAYAALREHGLGIDAARAAALLGRALLAQGRTAEAEALSHESEALAGDDLKAAIAWRGVRAEALASRGEAAAAVELARAAVGIAAATDGVLDHADARLALAAALRAAGSPAEAAAEEARAAQLWEQKGATVLAERARAAAGRAAASKARAESRPEPVSAVGRRVRENAGTDFAARLNAAAEARDMGALPTLFSDAIQLVARQLGAVLDREAILNWWRLFFADPDASLRLEPLASLGESLVLCRQSWAGSATGDASFDVGAFGRDVFDVFEVDAEQRATRAEGFGEHRLGDAVAFLYQRYAELLPEGPARARAEATARSVAVLGDISDPDRWTAAIAPAVEFVDHRPVGLPPSSGEEAFVRILRSLHEVADDLTWRVDDVLALHADAQLFRWTNSGTDRAGGGAFERQGLVLRVFGSEGLLTRHEFFHPDRAAEALTRFDALTAQPAAAAATPRRVRANLATQHVARLNAAGAARDLDAIAALLADDFRSTTSQHASLLGREQILDYWRHLFTQRGAPLQLEALASLGDSLALVRHFSTSSSGSSGAFEVGPFESEFHSAYQVDAGGRAVRVEVYNNLGDAVARLYERYAELLPDGPEKRQVAATARSLATLLGPFDPERWIAAYAPGVAFTDHRPLGLESVVGADALLRQLRTLPELAGELRFRVEDVLALGEGALVLRMSNSGTLRASGGAFERQWVQLFTFGPDGLVTRAEMFAEAGADAALTRFDALAAEPPASPRRRVRENAATANVRAVEAAVASRNADVFESLLSSDATSLNHTTGTELDRPGMLRLWRSFLTAEDFAFESEPIATLGDRLALAGSAYTASGVVRGSVDIGAYERETVVLVEVDAAGCRVRSEHFAEDRLGDAVARLYERYAELLPECPERTRAVATARSVAGLLGDDASLEAVIAADIAYVDRRMLGVGPARGAESFLRGLHIFGDLASARAVRIDDVISLRSNALLVRTTDSGTDRASGGAYEREFLRLWSLGPDGLVTHIELFDVDREAEAFARFDAISAERSASTLRRVRPNAATENAARFGAAIRARDTSAVGELYAESAETVHHPTGGTWGRDGTLAAVRESLAGARSFTYRDEPLASLGESLALIRQSLSGDGLVDGSFDVGPTERDDSALVEVDADGRRRRTELFAPHHLGDAVVRLLQCQAEGLPHGAERTRAAGTARSLAAMLGPVELDRYASAIAPDIEAVDHRRVALPPARGAEAYLRPLRSLVEVSEHTAMRVDDILALRPGADLLLWTNFGAERTGGGAYERTYLRLAVYGSDGRITRSEFFEPEHAAAALARFDALAAEPAPAARRPVRANAATENAARSDAAIAAGDAGALESLLGAELEVLDHTTGTSYGRDGVLAGWRSLLRAGQARHQHEALATLGDSLALCRHTVSASTGGGARFDVGPFESEKIYLLEVDARGLRRRHEAFRTARLGDAVARLYSRHADLLLDGPARASAERIARVIAFLMRGEHALDETLVAPDVVFLDRRPLGLGGCRGAVRFLKAVRIGSELESAFSLRVDDVLELRPAALLCRCTWAGTDARGGGAFERELVRLWFFAADGRLAREEWFDPGQQAEALARFDALTSAARPARRRPVRPNAATRNAERFDAALAARDLDAIDRLLSPSAETLHHPTGASYDRGGTLATVRDFGASFAGLVHRREALATLGESLGLFRAWFSAFAVQDERFDVGAVELETINLVETDARGLRSRVEVFAPDHLADAIVRLYTRHAEREPAGRKGPAEAMARAAGTRFRRPLAASDLVPDFEFVDHRPLGLGRARGVERFLAALRVGLELEQLEFEATQVRDVVTLGPASLLLHWPMRGTGKHGGGPFERDLLRLFVHAGDGRLTRIEWFDPSQEAEALARFDEISREGVETPRIENAASRCEDQFVSAWNRHDWDGVAALHAPGYRYLDRRPMFQLDLDRPGFLEFIRQLFDLPYSRLAKQLLATRGERLALMRLRVDLEGRDFGPSETESLVVGEVDAHGRRSAFVRFEADALDAAYEELDARFDAGEAAPWANRLGRRIERTINARDWEGLASLFAPDLVLEDHRSVGVFGLRSADEYVAVTRGLVELAPDATLRAYHILALNEKASLGIGGWEGHREGGPFEIVAANVNTWDAEGRVRHIDVYGLDQLDAARARYAELAAAAPRIENAATRALESRLEAWNQRDWQRFASSLGAGFRMLDRRSGVRLELGRAGYLDFLRPTFEMHSSRASIELIATRGERLVLVRALFEGAGRDIGPTEIETLQIVEVDERGEPVAYLVFDPDALDTAFEELDARYDAGEAAPYARIREARRRVARAIQERDWEALAATFAPGFVSEDHRPAGVLHFDSGDEYVASVRAVLELAPDAVLRTLHTLAIDARRMLSVTGWSGTRDGGAFDTSAVLVQSLAADGRSERFDMYGLEQLDQARARYEALRPDLLRIPPNASTRTRERLQRCIDAQDWDGVRALCAPMVYEDRRPLIRITGDGETFVRSAQVAFSSGARLSRSVSVLATAGDRLDLVHLEWSGDLQGTAFEAEMLELLEVDTEGRVVAMISFDPDDRAAASRELFERWVRDGVVPPALAERGRAHLDRDLPRIRSLLPADFVFHDQRRAGAGRLESPEDFVAWIAGLFQESPDAIIEPLYFLAIEPHATLSVSHTFGTNQSGGAFESVYVSLNSPNRVETFDLEDLDRARARFEELCAERADP
jgi:class 3 adenylate cyclase/ketosteroid isomerase-like protein